jgi:hypothetical protein
VPDVRSADARSRKTDRRKGVADSFQVILNNVKPAMGNRCFNLFTKNCLRPTLSDEMEPGRPEMPIVVHPAAFTCL